MLYDIIYADPPWEYENKPPQGDPSKHYPLMKLDDIKNLDVPAKDNSVCFLWTTAPLLVEGLDVLQSWGFKYKTHLIWDKKWLGLGYWVRGLHEILLIGVRGNFSPPTHENEKLPSIVREKRTTHSKKPKIIRKLICEWYPNHSKIELFARERFEGWVIWGNEVDESTLCQKALDSYV